MNGSIGRPGLWSIPGNGVLARQGDLIVLTAIDERGLVEKLLDSLARASEGADDGRRLADAIEDLVENDETWGGGQEGPSAPAVIAIGPAGAALAVMVSGTAWAEITTARGTDRLVAGQPAAVLRCVVADPVHAVRGGLGTGRGAGDRTDRFSRLERGSVRAGGLSYHLGLPAAHLDLPAAPPQGAAGPAAVAPLAHDAGAPDGASPDSAAGTGAAAPGPAAEEAAGARQRPSPVPPPRQPDAAEPHPTEPETAEPEEAEPVAVKAAAPVAKESAALKAKEAVVGKALTPVAEKPLAGEPETADSGTAEPEAVEPAAVVPAARPQADPVRPVTEKAQVTDLGADPAPAPSHAAVPAQQAADPADAPPLPPADASKDGTGAAVGAPLMLGVS